MGLKAGLDGCGETRPPPGFDLRIFQPIASRYAYCAVPAFGSAAIEYKNENQVRRMWEILLWWISEKSVCLHCIVSSV